MPANNHYRLSFNDDQSMYKDQLPNIFSDTFNLAFSHGDISVIRTVPISV